MQMCARRSDDGLKEGEEEAAEKEQGKEEFPLFLVLPFDFIVARIPLQSRIFNNQSLRGSWMSSSVCFSAQKIPNWYGNAWKLNASNTNDSLDRLADEASNN